ncbi:MAG: GDSL-type esterase/lipase family protein [Acidobacteriota bacterium]|nr:GDSL-type esterase/lipase family protein [Acidobacteriota bacterium]
MADQEELATTCSFAVTVSPPDPVCPAPLHGKSEDALPVPISWPLPTIPNTPAGAISCTPMSGSAFPVGVSTVTCTVDWTSVPTTADEAAPPTSCGFTVTIAPPDPELRLTRFLAFGDSITEGFVSDAFLTGGINPVDIPTILRGRGSQSLGVVSQAVEPFSSYPSQLMNLLTTAYATQIIVVTNNGISGEHASQGDARLSSSLSSFQPDVLLLLEGFNDINFFQSQQPPGSSVNISPIADNLRSMVQTAESRGIEVLLATLTPVTSVRETVDPGTQAAIDDLNDEIHRMAPDLGDGGIVDLYAAFEGVPGLIGADGFHPTRAGYRRIADVFLQEIQARFDVTARAPNSLSKRRLLSRKQRK